MNNKGKDVCSMRADYHKTYGTKPYYTVAAYGKYLAIEWPCCMADKVGYTPTCIQFSFPIAFATWKLIKWCKIMLIHTPFLYTAGSKVGRRCLLKYSIICTPNVRSHVQSLK